MKFKMTLAGKSLAAAALVLVATILALAATIAKGPGTGPATTPAVMQNIAGDKDQVAPSELARWIMEKKRDYQLVDVRNLWQYDDYHIPTAVSIPLAQLLEPSGLQKLSRGKKIVLYDLGTGRAAQAQLLLSMKGYGSYFLRDGITGWWSDIMTPTSVLSDTESPAGYHQAKQIRDFFLGTASPTTATSHSLIAVPPPPGPAPKQPDKKDLLKLGRGCS